KLAPCLGELTPGPGQFFGQFLDPAFRRGKIVGGRSCHDYTRFPYNLPVWLRAAKWRLASEAVGNATRYGGSMGCSDPHFPTTTRARDAFAVITAEKQRGVSRVEAMMPAGRRS